MLRRTKNIATTFQGAIAICRNSLFTRQYLRWYANHGGWIPDFVNRYRGEDCFILGNGPSLNEIDFDQISRFHLIGLNKIFLLFERKPLDLTFHVAVNSLVIQQSHSKFAELSCPSFLSYAPAYSLVPDGGNIHYIFTSSRLNPVFGYALDQPLWEGYTVTYVAMQLAFFMGFRRVFLVGVDHNFKAQGSPNEEQSLTSDDPNHFDPRYFKGQQWHLPDIEGSEMAYRMARFAFERNHREVVDATIGGACEIFRKIDIAQAFRECRPKLKK